MFDLVGIVHEVDCLDGSSFFGLSVVFHDERDVPDDDDSFFGSGNGLRGVGDENSLSECFLGWDFGRVELKSSLAALPQPE